MGASDITSLSTYIEGHTFPLSQSIAEKSKVFFQAILCAPSVHHSPLENLKKILVPQISPPHPFVSKQPFMSSVSKMVDRKRTKSVHGKSFWIQPFLKIRCLRYHLLDHIALKGLRSSHHLHRQKIYSIIVKKPSGLERSETHEVSFWSRPEEMVAKPHIRADSAARHHLHRQY